MSLAVAMPLRTARALLRPCPINIVNCTPSKAAAPILSQSLVERIFSKLHQGHQSVTR